MFVRGYRIGDLVWIAGYVNKPDTSGLIFKVATKDKPIITTSIPLTFEITNPSDKTKIITSSINSNGDCFIYVSGAFVSVVNFDLIYTSN